MVKAGYRGANVQASGNELLTFGLIIVAVILVLSYLIRKTADDTVKGVTDLATGAAKAVTDAVTNTVKTVVDTSDQVKQAEEAAINQTVGTAVVKTAPFIAPFDPMLPSTLAGLNFGLIQGFNIAVDISKAVYGDNTVGLMQNPTAEDYATYPGVLLPDTSAPNPLIKPGYFTGGWPP